MLRLPTGLFSIARRQIFGASNRGLLGNVRLEANQGVENRQDVTPVFHHPLQNLAQTWFALGLPVPASQNVWRHFDIAAEFFGGMAPQKEAVEEGCLSLRILELPLGFVARDADDVGS